jgi:hypothetical protein
METDLVQFEEKQLAEIAPLLATSNQLHGVSRNIIIQDDATLKEANILKKDINAHSKKVKDLRLELTRPLDAVTKALIAKEREITEPLELGKALLSGKIIAYEEQLEIERQREEKRIDDIIYRVEVLYKPGMTPNQVEAGKKAAKNLIEELGADGNIPRVKLALINLSNAFAERIRDLDIEDARLKKRKLEDEQSKIDDERRRLEADKQRQEAEKAQLEIDKAEAKAERDRPKSNIVETTEFEILDPDKVPRQLCSPDDRKIREFVKNQPEGELPLFGIRVFKTKKAR